MLYKIGTVDQWESDKILKYKRMGQLKVLET